MTLINTHEGNIAKTDEKSIWYFNSIYVTLVHYWCNKQFSTLYVKDEGLTWSSLMKTSCVVCLWPEPAGPLPLTLASLGKEWPSFLWTRHCVRSPGSGRPFHFMVHRPCAWLCCAFRCRGGNVSWNWCPCQRCATLPSFPASMSTRWLVNYHSNVKSGSALVPSSLALTANEELHMLERRFLSWPHLHWLNGNQTV